MKKFINKLLLLSFISLLPNLLVGLIRLLMNDDMIPFSLNISKDFELLAKKRESIYTFKKLPPPINDMSNRPVRDDSLIRCIDRYGSSNVQRNPAPIILYIGDSFFEDPRMNTIDGLQSQTNHIFNKNVSYNIGNTGNSGFQVYNELINNGFIRKPRLIVFEVVERHAASIFKKAPRQLINNEIKTKKYNYFFADFILGNNFNELAHSKIFKRGRSVIGTPKYLDQNTIWFMNNKLTIFRDTITNALVDSMIVIRDHLKKDSVDIVFVIAPDKESVYPDIYGKSNLLKVHEAMLDRGIAFINMHTEMENKGMMYYYDGDTHWNNEAISLLIHKLNPHFQKYVNFQTR